MRNHLLAAALIVLAGAPAIAQAADKPAPAAAQTADVPAEVKAYVTTASSYTVPYTGQVTIGRPIDGDQVWHQIPSQPAYRWTDLNGQKVVVDKKTGHVVAVY